MKPLNDATTRKGIWYLQIRIPEKLRAAYGGDNFIRESLRTRDRAEAAAKVREKAQTIRADFDRQLAEIERPATPKPAPTPQSFADIAKAHGRDIAEGGLTIRAELYQAAIADKKAFFQNARREFASDAAPDAILYFDKLAADGDLDRIVSYVARSKAERRIAEIRRMIQGGRMAAFQLLAEQRYPGLDDKGNLALALLLAERELDVWQQIRAGDSRDAAASFDPSPSKSNPISTTSALPSISLDSLFDKWKAETKPSASTLSTWGGHIRALKKAFPDKAEDAGTLTPEDMIKWKDDLVAANKSAKTINDSYFAAVRTVFTYGVNNRLVPINPGIGVKTAGTKKAGTSKQPYSNAEVARLLELARGETSPAKRWLPWLAAQTGSRIGEVAQLQSSYVKEEDGIHYLDIKPAPDAGSIKEEFSERTVPLHPQLIEDGFLDFVASKGDGPLFYKRSSGDPTKKHASKGVTNHLGSWIRSNGFTDPRKAPSHALRHWFKTEASRVGIDSRDVDKLQGHAPRSEADKYYHPDLAMKLAALKKLKLPPVSVTALIPEADTSSVPETE